MQKNPAPEKKSKAFFNLLKINEINKIDQVKYYERYRKEYTAQFIRHISIVILKYKKFKTCKET